MSIRKPGACGRPVYAYYACSRYTHNILSLYREKALHIGVAAFGKKCYTNVRNASKVCQQGLLC